MPSVTSSDSPQLVKNGNNPSSQDEGARSVFKTEEISSQGAVECSGNEINANDSNSTDMEKPRRGRHRLPRKMHKRTLSNVSGAMETQAKPSPKKVKSPTKMKRKRRMTIKVQEALMAEEGTRIEKDRPKRSYKKRSNKKRADNSKLGEKVAGKNKGTSSDEDTSLEYENISCCVCNCAIDYSEREAFSWPSETYNDSVEFDRNNDDILQRKQPHTAKKEGISDIPSDQENHQSISDLVSTPPDLNEQQPQGKHTSPKLYVDSIKKQGEGEGEGEGEEGNGDAKPQLKIPVEIYDPENALLICDTPGCNRSYHQRCHFVPIFCIPKREWYCLICQFKKELMKNKRTSLSPKAKSKELIGHSRNHNPSSNILFGKDAFNALSKPMTISEVDALFPVPGAPLSHDTNTIRRTGGPTTSEIASSANVAAKERFEFHSAYLKSTILERELSRRIKSTIDFNLGRVRLSQNTIRAYTQTNRARKALLESYKKRNTFPQEFNQSVLRMAESKQKIRGIAESLQRAIQNRNDRLILEKWISQRVIEHDLACAKNSVRAIQALKCTAVDVGQAAREEAAFCSKTCVKDVDRLTMESTFFTGSQKRQEPRFDLHDYDGCEGGDEENIQPVLTDSANDETSSVIVKLNEKETELVENSTEKIKCMMCFSGHVEHNNDVIMCDGEQCFRAFHMQCITPKVTQKMLDNDVNGTWFCPFCTAFANLIHYVEDEYFGDERGCEHDDGIDSSASWANADDVFPEADSEFLVAKGLKEGTRNKRSEEYLSSLLGIEIGEAKGMKNISFMNAEISDCSDDESDGDYSSSDDGKKSYTAISSDDVSSVEWDINRSEVAALSSDSSEQDSSEENSLHTTSRCSDANRETPPCSSSHSMKRHMRLRTCRLNTASPTSGDENKNNKSISDVGTLDTSNIILGRRKRTKVDYRR